MYLCNLFSYKKFTYATRPSQEIICVKFVTKKKMKESLLRTGMSPWTEGCMQTLPVYIDQGQPQFPGHIQFKYVHKDGCCIMCKHG